MDHRYIFGPVPSRRLGRSLGVNNVPPKTCSYACVYCQLGNLAGMTRERKPYYDPSDILREVEDAIRDLDQRGERPDFLTIVPDGEPTLDRNLGKLITQLKPLGIQVAVISNASTLHLPEVREELGKADWVSLKVDSVQEATWKRVDRPHGKLHLEDMLIGLEQFSSDFHGTLVTETMLVKDINDSRENITENAGYLAHIRPNKSYLALPTRPPAETWVLPTTGDTLNQAYQIYRNQGLNTELLIGYEGNEFSSTGDLETDLLSITAVHPLREDAVEHLLKKTGESQITLEKLIKAGKVGVSEFQGQRYYIRKFTKS
jgi:wyosine [tRNA(Phe)-imidazoG37] synthetase (radical SAM superfamily)